MLVSGVRAGGDLAGNTNGRVLKAGLCVLDALGFRSSRSQSEIFDF